MLMILVGMINPRWSVSTVTRWDTLPRSVEHQGTKMVSSYIKTTLRSKRNNEDTSSKAMLAIDGVGFDWSDMAEEHCSNGVFRL
ncbi:hypothetical protein Tco_0314892 [Tanacetum coccineum]